MSDIVERLRMAPDADFYRPSKWFELMREAADEIERLQLEQKPWHMTPEQAAYVPDIVKNAMLVAWREICGDTGCHPLDIEHGKRKFLTFEPRHWAQMTGDIVAIQVAKLLALDPVICPECTDARRALEQKS